MPRSAYLPCDRSCRGGIKVNAPGRCQYVVGGEPQNLGGKVGTRAAATLFAFPVRSRCFCRYSNLKHISNSEITIAAQLADMRGRWLPHGTLRSPSRSSLARVGCLPWYGMAWYAMLCHAMPRTHTRAILDSMSNRLLPARVTSEPVISRPRLMPCMEGL